MRPRTKIEVPNLKPSMTEFQRFDTVAKTVLSKPRPVSNASTDKQVQAKNKAAKEPKAPH